MSTLQERLNKARNIKNVVDPSKLNVQEQQVTVTYTDEFLPFKERVHQEILDQINFNNALRSDSNKEEVKNLIRMTVDNLGGDIPRPIKNKLVTEIFDETIGLGPLESLLKNDEITEIMVNGPRQVYIERNGKIELSSVAFRDDNHVLNIIDRIISPLGRRCDESTPMVDARLADGSRVNAIIPPVSLVGPTITIRKFSKTPLEISDLIKFNSLSHQMSNFLEACVKGKANIMVFGGTGSGKTTLLNTLSGFIPTNERIVTIEDAAELQLKQPHVVTLESRPPNVEGSGEITIRDLVRNSLRMRPDRIVVGEVRSGEALDMLQAMNTGHDGSLTTAHANSSRDLLSRLETMVLMAGMGLPSRAIREQISSAFNIIVHQSRLRDGSRKVVGISEVMGMEGDTIILQDIFVFEQEGFDATGSIRGKFVPTGIRPRILERIHQEGVLTNDNWFKV
ncbi:MAG: CpaF family protein [Erysipelotrichaceae bacterium]|jgi:pilus assembly protein CpaF|nr:CpaF family protein [Bacillota bacterium]NLP21957.1 CpaF family protein [Erysipelotrichaceae bacterium]